MSFAGAFLLIFSMIHAYVFAVILIMKKHTAKVFLALYMFTIALEYFLLLNNKVFKIDPFNYLFFILTPAITLTSLPAIYFYVRRLTTDTFRFQWKMILHFLPALLSLLFSSYFVSILPESTKYELLKGNQPGLSDLLPIIIIYGLSILLMVIQVIGYSIHMFILLYRHDKNLENIYSSKDEVSLKWLKIFVILYVSYCLYEVLVLIINGVPVNETIYYSIISLHVFVVGIFGIRQRDIYWDASPNEKDDTITEEPVKTQFSGEKKSSGISEMLMNETILKLEHLMNIEKRYRDEELSLYDLSNELKINRNYLSQIINEHYNGNFYNYINQFRIEEAKAMLLDPKFDHLSIEGIAKSVGFKTRNVFYPVFKKFVGVTPLEFKIKNRPKEN
jgi:AraC-like DNA-binding protein